MTRAVSLAGALFAVVFFIIAGSAYGMLRTRLSAAEVAAVDLRALPYQLGRWRGVDGPGLAKVARDILKLDHALKRTYTDADGNMIDLYIGYWTHQSGEHQAAKHSPAICLPANGWSTWSHSEKLFKFPQTAPDNPSLRANSLIAQSAQRDFLFHYWFFSGKRTYANEWSALLFITIEKLLHNRSDGGLVEISTPLGQSGGETTKLTRAEQRLHEFTQELYPELMRLVAK